MAKLADSIVVSIGGEAVELRPSLRFAIRLERRPGSFAGLLREIMDGSLTAACEIIRDHADIPMLETRILDSGLETFREPLVRYVLALTGMDDTPEPANDNGKAKGKFQPFSEYLSGLYKIGTGWLGWTPQDTLDATPAEIMLAHEGRIALLKSIFGGTDDKPAKPESNVSLDDKFRGVFGGFGTKIVQREKGA
jgi:hypothetical protein